MAGLTVLVVDDNEGNRALAKATLEDEGYDVVLAEGGEAGIAAFERVHPQCVLLDIQMPGMNGIAACQRIRVLPSGADVAIVFVTAQHEGSTLDRAMIAGGDDFLTKPFRPSELVVRVQSALRLRSLLRERNEQRDVLERFQKQTLAVNEHLLVSSVRAHELVDDANAARNVARLNEERFRTLVMTSSALVWQATAEGHVDHEGWQQFTGVDAGRGQWGWLKAVHPADQDRVREAWTQAVAAVSPYVCQLRIRRREGGYASVVARAAPIPTSGPVREWIGMLTDISDRVRVDEARERFIGILGHDLRNPLNAIVMGVELLGDLPAPHSNVVATVARSAHRMEVMIRDVLDFARGRLGDGIPVVPSQVDLHRVCEEIVAEMTQAYPARTFSFEAAGDLRGEWDPDRVEQVLSNLVGNAVTHGEGAVRVTASDAGGDVVMTVHNQGAAIPAAMISTLFDPFSRAVQDVSGKHGAADGLGLGLYIASEIVHAHGGTITVSSVQGEGTTFAVRWPRKVQRRRARTTTRP